MATAGDYTGEQTWNPGAAPGISAPELNRLEDGLVEALGRDVRFTDLGYDASGNLTSVTEKDSAAGTTVSTTTLGYDASGNLTTVTQTVNGQTITTTLAYSGGDLDTVTRSVA